MATVAGDRERFYRETLHPYKLRGYFEYLEKRTAWRDFAVLVKTVLVAARLAHVPAMTLVEIEASQFLDGRHTHVENPRDSMESS